MKVLFIYPSCESIAIEYLSAVLKKNGHEIKLFFDPVLFNDNFVTIRPLAKIFSYEKKMIKEIKSFKPDLIAFSVMTDTYSWAVKMSERIKKESGAIIVFGGIHPTSVPEDVIKNECVDFAIVGEGEHALLELANNLERKKPVRNIRNLWAKENGKIIKNKLRPLIGDLDELPFPDKDIFYEELPSFCRKIYTIVTSRGCPYNCTYCCNNFLRRTYRGRGAYIRRRSVDNVIQELKLAKKKYGIRRILFHDEVFTYDIKWLREFAKKYSEEIKLPFFCWVHPDTINEKTVSLLKYAGCRHVQMGIQSINETTRKKILNRHVSNKKIKKAIRLLTNADIFLAVDYIFGIPGQKEREMLNTAKFYSDNKADILSIYWLRYYPKTEINEIAKDMETSNKTRTGSTDKFYTSESFLMKGNTFDEKKARIKTLVHISQLLPRSIIDFFIEKKIYRLFPETSFLTNYIFITVYNGIFGRKKQNRIQNPIKNRLLIYLHFGLKKFIS